MKKKQVQQYANQIEKKHKKKQSRTISESTEKYLEKKTMSNNKRIN